MPRQGFPVMLFSLIATAAIGLGPLPAHSASAEQALEDDHATEADLDATEKRMAGFAEWGDRQSPLALTAKMRYGNAKAWNARGNGWSGSVSENGWQTFESQNKMAMEAWHKLQPIDDLPAVAYQYFVDAARDLSFSDDDT